MSKKKKQDEKEKFVFEKTWPPKRQKTKAESRQKDTRESIAIQKQKSKQKRDLERMELKRQQAVAKAARKESRKHTPGEHNRNYGAGQPDNSNPQRGINILKADRISNNAKSRSKKKSHKEELKSKKAEKGVL